MRKNIYSKYRCNIDGCRQMVNGGISNGTRDDGSFRMRYYCTMHYTQQNRIVEEEFKKTHTDMGYYWKKTYSKSRYYNI